MGVLGQAVLGLWGCGCVRVESAYRSWVREACRATRTRAANISLTWRNWLIGAHIHHYKLRGADRASYGANLLVALAESLRA